MHSLFFRAPSALVRLMPRILGPPRRSPVRSHAARACRVH